jgi:hypothetical protein
MPKATRFCVRAMGECRADSGRMCRCCLRRRLGVPASLGESFP